MELVTNRAGRRKPRITSAANVEPLPGATGESSRSRDRRPVRSRRRVGLAVVLVASLLLPAVGVAQDLTAVDEMVLQGDRLAGEGRHCQAAERYRAVVGERPDLFRAYAEERAACLGGARDDQEMEEGDR